MHQSLAPWTAEGPQSGLPDRISSSLRRTYPRHYSSFTAAIARADVDPADVADLDVHAGHLRLSSSSGATVAEIPFPVSDITPLVRVDNIVLDRGRDALFLMTDGGDETPAARSLLFDRLRRHYWLVEGESEPGATSMLFGSSRLRATLAEVLDRSEVAVVHPRIRAIVRAVDRGQYTKASDVAQNLRRASLDLRRSGLDPVLQRTLDVAARLSTQVRRSVQPVLAIRRISRVAILADLGSADEDSLRRVLADPAVLGRLARSYLISADAVGAMNLSGLLRFVDGLREFEFLSTFVFTGTGAAPDDPAASLVPDTFRELSALTGSLSRTNTYLFAREQVRRTGRPSADRPPIGRAGQVIGFFPGLGSRGWYRGLGSSLFESGMPAVVGVYQEAAAALGLDRAEALLFDDGNLPEGRLARQGFLGAALLVHNLAIERYLRSSAERRGIPLAFAAYAGESFGVITAAVAAGAVSVGDGARIAHAFTPLILLAAESGPPAEPVARALVHHLPDTVLDRPLVPEPSHVIALRGDPTDLAEVLEALERAYPPADIEVHKIYSWRQTNVYVRAGVKEGFDAIVRTFPDVTKEDLKEPTTFLAHSARMRVVRHALESYYEENGVRFTDPHTPVVSNNNSGLLTTAAEVRNGILAVADEIMASQATAETLDSLHPDLVLELGLGDKSVRLLLDNNVQAPVSAYAANPAQTDSLLCALTLSKALTDRLARLHDTGEQLRERDYELLRQVFRSMSSNQFLERYFYRTMDRVIGDEILHPERDGSPAFHQFLETFQHTYSHRDGIDVADGELVLRARLTKRIAG